MSKNKNTGNKNVTKEEGTIVKKDSKKERKNSFSFIRAFFYMIEFIIVIGILGVALFLWNNPQFVSDKVNEFLNSHRPQTAYEADMKIQNSVDNLMVQVNRLTEQNGYFMNLKADSSVVLGMVERMNVFEKKLNNLSAVSNNGALILSAAMMVKEAAARGQPFEYEAGILKQLSEDRTDIENEVNEIYALSSTSMLSDKSMVDKFNVAYKKIIDESRLTEHGLNWYEKLINKIKEHIKIQHTDKQEQVGIYNKQNALDIIKALVDNQDFATAADELLRPENQTILEDENIKEWLLSVKTKLSFYQNLSKISAYSLILMKTENLKNRQNPELNNEEEILSGVEK